MKHAVITTTHPNGKVETWGPCCTSGTSPEDMAFLFYEGLAAMIRQVERDFKGAE